MRVSPFIFQAAPPKCPGLWRMSLFMFPGDSAGFWICWAGAVAIRLWPDSALASSIQSAETCGQASKAFRPPKLQEEWTLLATSARKTTGIGFRRLRGGGSPIIMDLDSVPWAEPMASISWATDPSKEPRSSRKSLGFAPLSGAEESRNRSHSLMSGRDREAASGIQRRNLCPVLTGRCKSCFLAVRMQLWTC